MSKDIEVSLVSVEDGITALGFRRVISVLRKINPSCGVYFIPTGSLYSIYTHLVSSSALVFGDEDALRIAHKLASSDLVCFSSMTRSSDYVEKISRAIKRINKKTFIIWGGVHPIIYSEEAIRGVDGICTGEGEKTIEIFYRAFSSGKDYLKTPGMWFNLGNRLIKNKNLKLNSNRDLESFPHLYYGLDCQIYDLKLKKFKRFTDKDYISFNGLAYRTVWTLGCPFSCSYCANDSFISIDKNYRFIRYASVDKIIEEIKRARRTYPFLSTVAFYDDNFIALPVEVIREFSEKYKKVIGLPFVVFGMHPNFVTEEKVDLLAKAGMNRCRMGIQSGSEKILKFYNRPTPLEKIKFSASILARAARKYRMIPPAYDIIIDNPLETRRDNVNTLKFLYDLKRPYTLTVFSLRAYPKTKLWDYFKIHPSFDIRMLTTSYLDTRKTMTSICFYLLGILKPPKFIFKRLLKMVRGYKEEQRYYPRLHFLVKGIYLISRAVSHLKKEDFSTITGWWVYFFWKIGLIGQKNR